MLKIGEFAQLSQVTVKTLHHYDELGLIRPVKIDPTNNYRYYNVDQLPRIHRIMALKEIGLSLEQVKLILDDDLPSEQIRGMLRLKQAEIEQRLREAERQKAMVEFRLRMIEAEVNFPVLDVVVKALEPMRVLSLVVQQHHSMAGITDALHQAIGKGLIRHTGATIDVFHGETILPLESPEISEGQHEILLEVEPMQESVSIAYLGDLKARLEPKIETAATLMLTGGNAPAAFERVALLQRWAVSHGYRLQRRVRYYHHHGPMQTLNRDEFVIEVQMPVEKVD